jgi:hypothetical protein
VVVDGVDKALDQSIYLIGFVKILS